MDVRPLCTVVDFDYYRYFLNKSSTCMPDKQVSSDEEGRVALGSPTAYRDDDDVGLDAIPTDTLDTQIPGAVRPKRKRSKGCCVCCGIKYV